MVSIKTLLKKPRFRIALATTIVVFTLATTISGTFAWFAATMNSTNITASSFSVKATGTCGITEMSLYKFDYGSTFYGTFETVDYLTPETGSVNVYDYNKEDNYFGVKEGDVWTERIETMNIYDPTDTVIRKIDLKEVNCNVIYKIDFESIDVSMAYLVASGSVLDLVPGANESSYLIALISMFSMMKIYYPPTPHILLTTIHQPQPSMSTMISYIIQVIKN